MKTQTDTLQSQSQPATEANSSPSAGGQTASPMPPPAPPAPPPAPGNGIASGTLPASNDLAAFLSNLNPDQLAKVRQFASAKGIATGPRKGANGGLLIEVEVPPEVVEPFQYWAESAGEPLVDFIRKIAADSLVAYCFQDWGQAASRGGAVASGAAETMKVPAAAAATGA